MTAPWCDPTVVVTRSGTPPVSLALATEAVDGATDILNRLTGGQFPAPVTGDTVRPAGCEGYGDWGPPSLRGVVGWSLSVPLARVVGPWPLAGPEGGMYAGAGCGACGNLWGRELLLAGPVTAISAVSIDGSLLPTAAYRLDNGHVLVRVDGGVWPHCQDMTKPPTATGTFQVIYNHGDPLPAGAVRSAESLAVELAKLWDPTIGVCKLPSRVTTITRQGLTMVAIDPLTVIKEGGTGLVDVDMWLASLKVARATRRARIYTPGVEPALRHTG